MKPIEQRTNYRENQSQPHDSALIYAQEVVVQPGQRILVDDLSWNGTDYQPFVDQLQRIHPGFLKLTNKELNSTLGAMIRQTVTQLSTDQETQRYMPKNTVCIFPGGGGDRLRKSLDELGYRMTPVEQARQQKAKKPIHSYLHIDTKRNPANRDQAIVSAESIAAIQQMKAQEAEIIVLVDDAIKGGGTLKAIIAALCTNPSLQKSAIIAATQVRFTSPTERASGKIPGVDGKLTLAAISAVGYDDKESAPLTYLSSFLKKEPAEDTRLEAIAGGKNNKWSALVRVLDQAKRQYMQDLLGVKDHVPKNSPEFKKLVTILTKAQDTDLIRRFLGDLLTKEELLNLAHRTETAKLFYDNTPADVVKSITKLSDETLERVQNWRRFGLGGYDAAFTILKNQSREKTTTNQRQQPTVVFQRDQAAAIARQRLTAEHIPQLPSFEMLVTILSQVDDPDTISRFLGDLLTKKEIKELADRTELAHLLDQGKSVAVVKKSTGMDRETVQRVKRWNQQGLQGYKDAFALL